MTLWTPDGERRIPPNPATEDTSAPPSIDIGPDQELTPEQDEQLRAMAAEMAEARAKLLEAEVSTVLANHALGIYELAAIHLGAEDVDIKEAKLAIDGLSALVDGLEGRLGDAEPTLKDALHQIRLAYVKRASEAE